MNLKRLFLLGMLFSFSQVFGQEVEEGNKKLPTTETKKEEPKPKPEPKKEREPVVHNTYSRDLPEYQTRMSFGLTLPGDVYKSQMSQGNYFNNPYLMAPITTGQMGGSVGGFAEIGGIVPLNGINRGISNRFFFYLPIGLEGGFMPYDMSYIADYFSSGTPGRQLLDNVSGSYVWAGPAFGPMISLNFGANENSSIDFTYKMKFMFQFLPEISESYYDGSTDYDITVTRESSEGAFDFANEIGASVRIGNFYLGVNKVIGFGDATKYTEVLKFNGTTANTYVYQAKTDLSGITVFLGFHI